MEHSSSGLLGVVATDSSALLITCSDVTSLLRKPADDCAARPARLKPCSTAYA